ncbi:MAG: hypothetical protein VB036_17680, partial [Propionicimonas sp.]|nr:hypothetical protein [Propionicimonas sp.]
QAASLLGVWDSLLDALRGLEVDTGVDIVVDAGRLGMVGSPEPLISESSPNIRKCRTVREGSLRLSGTRSAHSLMPRMR